MVIQEVDSVLIGGNYRKRWLLNPGYPILIEGIGAVSGFLEDVCSVVIEE